MHPRRRRERGYNQAGIAGAAGGPGAARCGTARSCWCAAGMWNRRRGTSSSAERVSNVAGSAAVAAGRAVAGGRIILVDDVATTRSTLEACARALKEAGAESVWGLTLAITAPRGRTAD